MANLRGFNANNVDPTTEFEPVPSGKYLAVIIDSEEKPNKAGTGSYLQLTFQVIEGEFKNRLIWARLNLENPNQTAVKIAQAELSAICRAVGVMQPEVSQDLHDIPLVISVKCKKRKDAADELTNEIKGYFKRETTPTQPAQAPSNTPVWRR
jgi:hypothetical protein